MIFILIMDVRFYLVKAMMCMWLYLLRILVADAFTVSASPNITGAKVRSYDHCIFYLQILFTYTGNYLSIYVNVLPKSIMVKRDIAQCYAAEGNGVCEENILYFVGMQKRYTVYQTLLNGHLLLSTPWYFKFSYPDAFGPVRNVKVNPGVNQLEVSWDKVINCSNAVFPPAMVALYEVAVFSERLSTGNTAEVPGSEQHATFYSLSPYTKYFVGVRYKLDKPKLFEEVSEWSSWVLAKTLSKEPTLPPNVSRCWYDGGFIKLTWQLQAEDVMVDEISHFKLVLLNVEGVPIRPVITTSNVSDVLLFEYGRSKNVCSRQVRLALQHCTGEDSCFRGVIPACSLAFAGICSSDNKSSQWILALVVILILLCLIFVALWCCSRRRRHLGSATTSRATGHRFGGCVDCACLVRMRPEGPLRPASRHGSVLVLPRDSTSSCSFLGSSVVYTPAQDEVGS